MLEIKDLNANVEGKQILKGINLSVKAWRSTRHHGAERLRQEHVGTSDRGP